MNVQMTKKYLRKVIQRFEKKLFERLIWKYIQRFEKNQKLASIKKWHGFLHYEYYLMDYIKSIQLWFYNQNHNHIELC